MSLHFHKSELIPTIDFKDGGMLFITDNDGTFPLRHTKKRSALPLPNQDDNDSIQADTLNFRSFDPKRDANKRRYKTKSQFMNDTESETGSQAISTLSRKGKLKRRGRDMVRPADERRWSTASVGTVNTANTGSTVRNKLARKRKEKTGSISSRDSLRSNGYGTIGSGTLKRRGELPNKQRSEEIFRAKHVENLRKAAAQKDTIGVKKSLEELGHSNININGKIPYLDKLPKLEKKIADEKLPWKLMIVCFSLLFILGIVCAAINPWHHYYCLLWSSLLVCIQGILGKWNDGDYLTPSKNRSYIISGIVATTATLTSSGLILHTFAPICAYIAGGSEREVAQLKKLIPFSYHNKVAFDESKKELVWIVVGLDAFSLIVCMFSFYCLSASMICLSNFWDACYKATGVCNHRGHPAIFNPMQQVSFSTCCVFVGLVALSLTESLQNHYYSPIWPGPIIMTSSILSVAAAKRPDAKGFNLFAITTQIACLIVCTCSTAFMTLALYEDSKALGANKLNGRELQKHERAKLIGSAAAEAVFCLVIILTVIFVVGVTFRQGRNIYAQRSRNVQLAANGNSNGYFRTNSGTYA